MDQLSESPKQEDASIDSENAIYKEMKCSKVARPHAIVYRIKTEAKTSIGITKNTAGKETASSTSTNNKKTNQKHKTAFNFSFKFHRDFRPLLDTERTENELKSGQLIKGSLRVSQNKPYHCYVFNEDANNDNEDYIIKNAADRNASLNGDIVVIRMKETDSSDILQTDSSSTERTDNPCKRKIGEVVHILKKVHNRLAVGYIRRIKGNSYELVPHDKRIPIIRLSNRGKLKLNKRTSRQTLYLVQITQWIVETYAEGLILRRLGWFTDLKVQNLSIEMELNMKPISIDAISTLRQLSKVEEYRLDLRHLCVFTIDPKDAKDLDDAISIECLANGNIQISVHIADVSAHLPADSLLDKIVRCRTTSTYLVDKVIHMLPVEVCERCSLTPGLDKYTFSIFWEMEPTTAEIVRTHCSRATVNSCVQLSYEQVQQMLDTNVCYQHPPVRNGHSIQMIIERIQQLNHIARVLRRKRYENGAFSIDQIKLNFTLAPLSCKPEVRTEAHFLIEEFMLLSNISVAEIIRKRWPQIALLRQQSPPDSKQLSILCGDLKKQLDCHLNIDSGAQLRDSLEVYRVKSLTDATLLTTVKHMVVTTMRRALYCVPDFKQQSSHHYALNVPLYTHFTSPIRRYVDIVVHRLLAASLGYSELPADYSRTNLQRLAQDCNAYRFAAKRAEELSRKLHYAQMLRKKRGLVESGRVVVLSKRGAHILLTNCGFVVRIKFSDCCRKYALINSEKGNNDSEEEAEEEEKVDDKDEEEGNGTEDELLVLNDRFSIRENFKDSSIPNKLKLYSNQMKREAYLYFTDNDKAPYILKIFSPVQLKLTASNLSDIIKGVILPPVYGTGNAVSE